MIYCYRCHQSYAPIIILRDYDVSVRVETLRLKLFVLPQAGGAKLAIMPVDLLTASRGSHHLVVLKACPGLLLVCIDRVQRIFRALLRYPRVRRAIDWDTYALLDVVLIGLS